MPMYAPRSAILATIVLLLASRSNGGLTDSDTQAFRVRIPPKISIVAPAAQDRTHGGGRGNLAFSRQDWRVATNSDEGATVVFATDHSFWSLVDPAFRRDAQLSVSIVSSEGPATWRVRTRTATTNYDRGQEVASVRVDSNNVGRATLGLFVRFITGDVDTLVEGDYRTTVTGTITSTF